MKILVTGASGLLGSNFLLSQHACHELLGVYHASPLSSSLCRVSRCDLTSKADVERLIAAERPDCIVNCAALANIDACEKDPQLASALNTELPARLALLSARKGIKFVQVSTDAVFNGVSGGYTETDLPVPINVYGSTKLEGERRVLEISPDAIVARVNFFGWSLSGKRSLAEWFYNNLIAGHHISGYDDIYFCPLLANTLCDVLVSMVGKGARGLFHVVGSEAVSKYDFGVRLAVRFGLNEKLIARAKFTSTADVAARGGRMELSVAKLKSELGIELPGVDDSLTAFYGLFRGGYPAKMRAALALREA